MRDWTKASVAASRHAFPSHHKGNRKLMLAAVAALPLLSIGMERAGAATAASQSGAHLAVAGPAALRARASRT